MLNVIDTIICIQPTKGRQEILFDVDFRELRVVLWLAAPSLFHRIDKLCGFVVAEIRENGDVEGCHHVMVFVNSSLREHQHNV
jgi:hypothetical protein